MIPDVATFIRTIEEECQSMNNGLYGLASVARHRIIAHKYSHLTRYRTQLARYVGDEAATETVAVIYNGAMEKKDD